MFIVLLRFSDNKGKAGEFMDGHKDWIQRGYEDGVFLLTGSLKPGLGGGILAHNATRAELESRVEADPFVAEKVVEAEILELDPSNAEPRLDFLIV